MTGWTQPAGSVQVCSSVGVRVRTGGRDIASGFSPVAQFLMSCVSSLACPIFSYLLGYLRTLVVLKSFMTVVQLHVLYSGEWEDYCVW